MATKREIELKKAEQVRRIEEKVDLILEHFEIKYGIKPEDKDE